MESVNRKGHRLKLTLHLAEASGEIRAEFVNHVGDSQQREHLSRRCPRCLFSRVRWLEVVVLELVTPGIVRIPQPCDRLLIVR